MIAVEVAPEGKTNRIFYSQKLNSKISVNCATVVYTTMNLGTSEPELAPERYGEKHILEPIAIRIRKLSDDTYSWNYMELFMLFAYDPVHSLRPQQRAADFEFVLFDLFHCIAA